MAGYTIYNGKPHYWRTGVAKRFRETIDPNFTDDEVTSVLGKMRFPIASKVEDRGGKTKVYGLYDTNLIEDWIATRKGEIREKLKEKREYDARTEAMKILGQGKMPKTVSDPRSTEETEAEWERKAQERRGKREEEMRRKMEAEMKAQEEKERENPEENMERVPDELLRNDDVYYEGKEESGGKKINEGMNLDERNAVVSDTIKKISEFIGREVEPKFYHKEGEDKVASSEYEKGGIDAVTCIHNFLHYYESFPEKLFNE